MADHSGERTGTALLAEVDQAELGYQLVDRQLNQLDVGTALDQSPADLVGQVPDPDWSEDRRKLGSPRHVPSIPNLPTPDSIIIHGHDRSMSGHEPMLPAAG